MTNDSQTILRIITEKNEAIILNLLLEVHDNYWFNDIYILSVTRSITRFYLTMDDDDLK